MLFVAQGVRVHASSSVVFNRVDDLNAYESRSDLTAFKTASSHNSLTGPEQVLTTGFQYPVIDVLVLLRYRTFDHVQSASQSGGFESSPFSQRKALVSPA